MKLTENTAKKIMCALMERGDCMEWADSYGEPGYSLTPGRIGMITGDWWHLGGIDYREAGKELVFGGKYPRLVEALSEWFDLDWYDEWLIDPCTNKAWRTQPDSYSWQSSVQWTEDGDPLTPDDDLSYWLEWAMNDATRCLPSVVWSAADLEAVGFIQDGPEFSNGWYGVEDDPKAIAAQYRRIEPDGEYVFLLSGVGQFDIDFKFFTRLSEAAQERADWAGANMADE